MKQVKAALEVIRHNADLGFSYPELAIVPAEIKRVSLVEDKIFSIVSERKIDSYPKVITDKKEDSPSTKYSTIAKPLDAPSPPPSPDYFFELGQNTESLLVKKERISEVFKSLRDKIKKGLIFQEQLGDFTVYLLLGRIGDSKPDTFEIIIQVYDQCGEPDAIKQKQ